MNRQEERKPTERGPVEGEAAGELRAPGGTPGQSGAGNNEGWAVAKRGEAVWREWVDGRPRTDCCSLLPLNRDNDTLALESLIFARAPKDVLFVRLCHNGLEDLEWRVRAVCSLVSPGARNHVEGA